MEGDARPKTGTPSRAPGADPLADVARRAVQGERAAVRALVEAVSPRVLGVARRILGATHPDVDDVTQESLMAILRAMPAFAGESTVLHYATRIAARTCLASRKRVRAQAEHRQSFAAEPDEQTPPEGMRPADKVVSERRRSEIRELLQTLPEEQAETIVLRTVLGMSLEEVAEATGTPLNTVRSRMRLAKEALRKRIDGLAPELVAWQRSWGGKAEVEP